MLQDYFGQSGFSHTNSGTAGFLFEMNADGTWVRSDTTWRMVTNTAFQLATTVPQPNARISESSLRYDARLDLGAWTNQNFNDSGWSSPTDRGPVGGLAVGQTLAAVFALLAGASLAGLRLHQCLRLRSRRVDLLSAGQ